MTGERILTKNEILELMLALRRSHIGVISKIAIVQIPIIEGDSLYHKSNLIFSSRELNQKYTIISRKALNESRVLQQLKSYIELEKICQENDQAPVEREVYQLNPD